jgi:hypothetical protein
MIKNIYYEIKMKYLYIFLLINLLLSCYEDEPQTTTSPVTSPLSLDKECKEISNQEEEVQLANKSNDFIIKTLRYINPNIDKNIKALPLLKSYEHSGNIESIKYFFIFKEDRICNADISISSTKDELILAGRLPEKNSVLKNTKQSLVEINIERKLQQYLKIKDNILTTTSEPCIYKEKKALYYSLSSKVIINKKPYKAIISNKKIHSLQPLFFHVRDITTQAYSTDEREIKKTLKRYTLKNISSSGTLCSKKFRVELSPYNNSGQIAFETSGEFIYNPETQLLKFEQASMFTHAEIQAEWITNLEFFNKWNPEQIILELYEWDDDDGLSNDAAYYPSEGGEKAKIILARGNGISLHNIRTDGEAVQHEVNHHIIYDYITYIGGESLILHEGLADAFVMLRNKNSCLGEFLCPKKGICSSNKCLRSADNNMNLNDADFPYEPHVASQAVSGFIWDIADSTKESSYLEVANLTYKALSLLSNAGGYEELIVNLLLADKNIYAGKYCNKIEATAKKRGFDKYIKDNECST